MQFLRNSFRPTSVSCTIKLGLLTLSDFFFLCVLSAEALMLCKHDKSRHSKDYITNNVKWVKKTFAEPRFSILEKIRHIVEGILLGWGMDSWGLRYRNEIIGLLRGIGKNRNNLTTEKNLYRQFLRWYGTGQYNMLVYTSLVWDTS